MCFLEVEKARTRPVQEERPVQDETTCPLQDEATRPLKDKTTRPRYEESEEILTVPPFSSLSIQEIV